MPQGTYRDTLRRQGLQPFLWTQFLGAFNDNVYKMAVALGVGAAAASGVAAHRAELASGAFILPFLLFSGYAAHMADTYSKRSVLVWMKGLEVAAMLLAIPALLIGRLDLELFVLFLMGTQAAFFSPAKYGIVPELLEDAHLSRANGLLEMSTFVAIVIGTAAGGQLLGVWGDRPWLIGALLSLIAAAGVAMSRRIPPVNPARPDAPARWNPFSEIWEGTRRLYANRNLWMTVVGLSYFWFLGALLLIVLVAFGQDVLHVGTARTAMLTTALSLGIGAGSLAAGRLSGDKIELGLVPIGSLGMGLFAVLLGVSASSYWLSIAALIGLGVSGGCFAVPLNALLQHEAESGEKGRLLGTNNFLNTLGILMASAVLWILNDVIGLTIEHVILTAGLFTLASSVYVLATLPDFFVRFTLWLLTHTVYRIKIVGQPNIPSRGPALLICNHVSMIDGALVGACIQRFVRFLVYAPVFNSPGLHWLMTRMHAIPIAAGTRRAMVESIEQARAELSAGHVVCIFAEGSVSRTGNLLPFKRGFERMVEGLDVPVIPVYLDRVWGSVFSFKRGKFFWKLPERWPYPVTVAFGAPMPSSVSAVDARQAILELGADALGHRRDPSDLLHASFMKTAKRAWGRFAMADTTGQRLTYGRALVGSLLLARHLGKRTEGQQMVGVLLPASVGGALTNIALLNAGRIPVNLNFTAGADAMQVAMGECGIRTVITSKRFIQKASIDATPAMIFLEDLSAGIGGTEKLRVLLQARLAPVRLLRRWYGGGRTADSLATVIFSSGSTGVPKGVMISHANILANVDSLAQIFPMDRSDCFIGVLPLFHSFGLTGTLWFPMLNGAAVAYHPNPMDAKTVGELTEKYRGTMLISTPTFCQAYARRCTPEQFASLKYAIVGAEKLRAPLAASFRDLYGIDLLEGYGCTELSPVIAVNRPDVGEGAMRQIGMKPGSVGHPIPGVAVRVVDQATGLGPVSGRAGLLLVKGPNLMQGYLGQPERTAEVVRDGWYTTGDIAMVDEDGFIFITDRLSRFSKIGGEMVPHIKIEDMLNGLLGDLCSAVTAIPDAARGERLVAFYTKPEVTPESLWEQLSQTDLPRLWLPRRDSLIAVEAIPTLGTGKVDLRALKQLAIQRADGALTTDA